MEIREKPPIEETKQINKESEDDPPAFDYFAETEKDVAVKKKKMKEARLGIEQLLTRAGFPHGWKPAPKSIFPKPTEQEFLDAVKEAGENFLIPEHIRDINPVLHNQIAQVLLETKGAAFLAAFLADFKGLEVDIALKLIKAAFENQVVENLPSFNLSNADKKTIAQKLIQENKQYILAKNIDWFGGLDEKTIFKIFDYQKDSPRVEILFWKHFIFPELSEETKRQIQTGQKDMLMLCERLKDRKAYAHFVGLLRFLEKNGIDVSFFAGTFSKDLIQTELDAAFQNEDYLLSESLIEIAQILQISVDLDAEKMNLISQQAKCEETQRKNREPKRAMYEKIKLHKEIILFYGLVSLQIYIDKFKNSLRPSQEKNQAVALDDSETETKEIVGKELPIKTQIELQDIEKIIQTKIGLIAEWMRIYLIKAVYSELGSQSHLHHPVADVLIPSDIRRTSLPFLAGQTAEYFISTMTAEEIRAYLSAAASRFVEKGNNEYDDWTLDYGGPKWRTIVDAAFQLWRPLKINDVIFMIDKVFQIQHNNNIVFDKDRRLQENVTDIYAFLDASFKASDFDDLLKRFKGITDFYPSIFEKLENLKARFDAVTRTPTRQLLGGD